MNVFPISGSRTLHRLVYASRCRIPSAELDAQIDRILETAIRSNRKQHITGLLLACRGWFVQALEGPAEAVMTTYGRILRDPRHDQATVISSGPVGARAFAAWNMCARRLSETDAAIVATLDRKQAFEASSLSPAVAMSLLARVADIQQRHAEPLDA